MTALQLLLLEQSTYLAQGFMLYYYAKAFFRRRYGVTLTLVNMVVGYIALYALSRTGNTVWNLAAILMFNTVLLLLLYREPLRTLLFHAAVLAAVQALSELLCLAVLQSVSGTDPEEAELFSVLMGRFLYFLLLLIIRRWFSKRRLPSEKESGFWALMVMPLASLTAVSVLLYILWHGALTAPLQTVCGGAAVLLLIANVVVFFFYERSLENASQLAELTAVRQKNELDRQHYDLVEQTNQEIKTLAHDMKNHLIAIRSMDSTEAVGTYIDKLYPQVDAVSTVGSSGNKMLDLIINKYQKLCQKDNIHFTAETKTANLHYVEDTDLSAMLSNLLDNAVEAAKKSIFKTVTLSVFNKNARCDAVVIENSCDSAPHSENGNLITTKNDRQLHGIGLKSVVATAQKYNALFDWMYDEAAKQFTVTLVFPKEDKQ